MQWREQLATERINDMKRVIIIVSGLMLVVAVQAQKPDSVNARALDSVTITSYLRESNITRLSDVQGTYIFSGKKSEVVSLGSSDIDITNKNARQTFAKVPGIFVYDMDGSGNQLNIATRGLDPHRGWDFNIRRDGIITNSDMYGYPASHYSMPLESISRIEIVRGTGSLQYGAQFGGMVNYITKRGDTSRPFTFESFNTAGSYNLLSTYNAIGGNIGKLNYYAYYHKKKKD
jgi:Fe(3+) dicitrate transport protein